MPLSDIESTVPCLLSGSFSSDLVGSVCGTGFSGAGSRDMIDGQADDLNLKVAEKGFVFISSLALLMQGIEGVGSPGVFEAIR